MYHQAIPIYHLAFPYLSTIQPGIKQRPHLASITPDRYAESKCAYQPSTIVCSAINFLYNSLFMLRAEYRIISLKEKKGKDNSDISCVIFVPDIDPRLCESDSVTVRRRKKKRE
jgi:hypothetical protein